VLVSEEVNYSQDKKDKNQAFEKKIETILIFTGKV
jgi:hypothetical protein